MSLRRKWRRCKIDTINNLYGAVAAGLKAVKDCVIYREDVPQGFKQPSFLVTLYDQNPSRGINGRLKNSVSVDVLYFPSNRSALQEECWTVGQELVREFVAATYKVKNRNLKIEDQVLHFMFDVDYRECRKSDIDRMRNMIQNTKLKEV